MEVYSLTSNRLKALISVTSAEFELIILSVDWAIEKSEAKQGAQTEKLKQLKIDLKKARLSWVKENNLTHFGEEQAIRQDMRGLL